MIQLQLQQKEELESLIRFRESETKLGEKITLCDSLDSLSELTQKFVIFGICEDIGVQANYGKSGASNAWNVFLNSFCNIQVNSYNKESNVILLGKITVSPDEEINEKTDRNILGAIVKRIDNKVAIVVQRIIEAGKIPIVIGGGHNNAYGNLKGATNALGQALNCVNIDAHTDLRLTDYRHSGNGFSYALNDKEGPYLNKYGVFGLHKNYTPQYVFNFIEEHNKKHGHTITYKFMEDMLFPNAQLEAFSDFINTIIDESFGLELDCDSIASFPSSAMSPSGFSLNTTRSFVKLLSASRYCRYFHICEAAPSLANSQQVGKALTYLVTDFIQNNDGNNII
ncbi:formimidoylglutamase [Dokdonia sp. Hel_I_53]|uniref:formimidoylglutamase n=1 Tax=Dokdonia sp. Hel_I_53 TaxID=1566287 RepID=UPI00119BD8A2|nr:formimidoylglutamase [Dokdonia sp. Hel_I_53]TVZ51005.1 formiminoglutamase [Dokdonia sp. Hel_I_53]